MGGNHVVIAGRKVDIPADAVHLFSNQQRNLAMAFEPEQTVDNMRSGTLERIIGNALKGNFRGQQFSISNAAKDVEYAGDLISTDPDGARIHSAVLAALKRPIDAGLGDRFVSEMLDPEVERKAR